MSNPTEFLSAKEFQTIAHKSVVMAMQKGYSIVKGTYGDPELKQADIFVAIALRVAQPSDLIDPNTNRWKPTKIRRAVKKATRLFLGKSIKSFQYNYFMEGINGRSFVPSITVSSALSCRDFCNLGKKLAGIHYSLSKRG